MSLSGYFDILWPLLLGFAFVEIAVLDPLFQLIKYQNYRYGRLFFVRRLVGLVTFDTTKWEPEDPGVTPGPTGGVMFILALVGLFLLFTRYFWVGLLALAAVGFIFVGMHYRDLNKRYEH